MKLKMLALMSIVLFSFSAPLFSETLELVTLQYPPYEYEENGEVKGLAVEIVKEVFKRLDQQITIKVYPWARALDNVKTGKSDAIFTAYKNPERETFADYSKGILMPQIVSFFVRSDSPITFDGNIKNLSSYKFGVVRKVSYGKTFDDAVKEKTISNIDISNDGTVNMKKLIGGRFDILVSNKYGALDILKKMNKSDAVKELSPELQSVPSYIAFSKKRNHADLRDQFDVILEKMKEDGTFDKIISTYFK